MTAAAAASRAAVFTDGLRRAAGIRPLDAGNGPAVLPEPGCTQHVVCEHWVDGLPAVGVRRAHHRRPHDTGVELRRTSRLEQVPAEVEACWSVLVHMSVVHETGVDAAGREWSSRAAPSAGGTHPIRPLLLIDGTTQSWWRGTGTTVQQVEAPSAAKLTAAASAAVRGVPVTGTLFAIAEPDLVLARYPDGESLLWRDAGAFLTVAHIAASGYGLRSRILGLACELDHGSRLVPAFAIGAVVLTGTGAAVE